jgi:hypothetical protein
LKIDIRFDFKEVDIPIEKKAFRIISCKIGRLSTGGMNAIDPTVRTERGLHLHPAEVTVTAGHSSVP